MYKGRRGPFSHYNNDEPAPRRELLARTIRFTAFDLFLVSRFAGVLIDMHDLDNLALVLAFPSAQPTITNGEAGSTTTPETTRRYFCAAQTRFQICGP